MHSRLQSVYVISVITLSWCLKNIGSFQKPFNNSADAFGQHTVPDRRLMITKCNEQELLQLLQSWVSVKVFTSIWLSLSILTMCFFGGMVANDDLDVYIIAHKTLFHPCKLGQTCTVPGWSLKAPVDVKIAGAWAILKFADDLQLLKSYGGRLICDHSVNVNSFCWVYNDRIPFTLHAVVTASHTSPGEQLHDAKCWKYIVQNHYNG